MSDAIEKKSFELLEDFNLLNEKTDLKALCKKMEMDVVTYPFTGCEGVLLVTKNSQKILIRGTQDSKRNRFTISHELGHYSLHVPATGLRTFNCSKEQVSIDTAVTQNEESEANKFASSLLMPKVFIEKTPRFNDPSWKLIETITEKYDVSRIAAGTRYVNLSSHSMWLIVVKSGYIQRFIKSTYAQNFPEIGNKLTTREIPDWMDISADIIFHNRRETRDKTVKITSLGQNDFGENLVLVWDPNHGLQMFEENVQDYDDDEFYERSSRGRW